MQQVTQTLLCHTKSRCIITTEGKNLTNGKTTVKPIRGTGKFTIPTALNHLAQRNENLIKLITLLKLGIEK